MKKEVKEIRISMDLMQVLKESLKNNNSELMKSWTCILDFNNFIDKVFISELKQVYLKIKNNYNTLNYEDNGQKEKYFALFFDLLECIKKYKKAVENRERIAVIFVNVANETISEIQKIIEILK
jgi:hypothetical protein